MVKSRFGYRTAIPPLSSSKGQTRAISFKDGVNTYKDNDDMKVTELAAAYDVRFVKIGRYQTRRGLDHYSVPVGEALNASVSSIASASVLTVSGSQALSQKLTSTKTERITRAEVRIRSTATSRGTVLVELCADAGGVPGAVLARSSIRAADVSSAWSYRTVRFAAAPDISNLTVFWVTIRGQSANVGEYEVSTTGSAATALSSATAGEAWSTTSVAANVAVYSSPAGGVKGLLRAYRSNGQKVTLFSAGGSVYSVNDTTGATAVVRSGFSQPATHVRTQMVQDATYWVNGLEKPWKYDFNEWTQITAAPYTPDLIIEHKGLLFFNDVEDRTRIFYSNFAEYDRYTSTDFIYVPAPKSYDGLTAFAKLNGVLYLFAKRNKFQLNGSDNDTFNLDEAPDQRGTFSQESVVFDANYIFHADEEGVHMFNGTESRNLAESFLEDYLAIPNKSTIQLELYRNRLYVFHGPQGAAANTRCFVYNLLLNCFEALDLGTPIGRTFSRYAQDDVFLQASNRVAAIYYGELSTNDHHNLGDQLQYELRTAYNHFDTPASSKRAPKHYPQFPSVTGSYAVEVGYDKDFAGAPSYSSVDVSGSGARLNTGLRLNTGVRLAGQRMVEPRLTIPGTFKRIQRRYRHVAAREPVELDSEVLTIETQRLN
ncbi:hypothetical protein [Rathayibacter sp. AY1C1]|uniref:hypothetical protein n=1 Tax=Rathayibacter sp. AY1C1 TaxID=2080534 RepID=UPI0011B05422|nr:hypothetical protein [Rathayibacter sp. AY1C1]